MNMYNGSPGSVALIAIPSPMEAWALAAEGFQFTYAISIGTLCTCVMDVCLCDVGCLLLRWCNLISMSQRSNAVTGLS